MLQLNTMALALTYISPRVLFLFPRLFNIYTKPLGKVIQRFDAGCHQNPVCILGVLVDPYLALDFQVDATTMGAFAQLLLVCQLN